MSTISASTTTTTAYKVTADTTGTLVLQTGATPTTAVTIDGSQNVGIGTSSPSAKLNLYQSGSASAMALIYNNTNAAELKIQTNANDAAFTSYYTNGNRNWSIGPGQTTANLLEFRDLTAGATRMGIDSSGNLLVGQTSTGVLDSSSFSLQGVGTSASIVINHKTGVASGDKYVYFDYAGNIIGSITQNGTTATAYNTSSDYRLKENVQPLTGALARIAALKPCTYTWKSAPDEIGEGFIAHELAEVVPHAVTGEKDAVNEDGSIKPQGIDTSFLVATLTAAIQEQQAIIQQLTTRIETLEAK